MKFIHAADLHIESPYKGIGAFNSELAKALIRSGYDAFHRLIQLCIDQEIDFLLISGDSFDSETGSLGAQYQFIKGMDRLQTAKINVYVICGNHDPLTSWPKHLKLPENVFLFPANKVTRVEYQKEGRNLAQIYGVSFETKEEYKDFSVDFQCKDSSVFSIGLLHGTISGNQEHIPYCPFELANLRASGIDYWALGHIHKREVLLEKNPVIIYPGNIQGRHFNETGEKGCYLVNVENNHVTDYQFVPLSKIIYEYQNFDATEVEDLPSLVDQLRQVKSNNKISGISYMLRLNAEGRTKIHSLLSDQVEMQHLLNEINDEEDFNTDNFVYINKIINQTSTEIDLTDFRQSSEFVSDLMKKFEDLSEDEEMFEGFKIEILEEILTSLVGREIRKESFVELLTNQADEIIEHAKWKCIDGLTK